MQNLLSLKKTGALRTRSRPYRNRFRRFRNTLLARRARMASKATFVGVTGSSAKSTTTNLVSHILSERGDIQALIWGNTLMPIAKAVRASEPNLDFFVVECAVGNKGDMSPIAKILQPDVAVVTLINLEHYSSFKTKSAVAAKKGMLVESIRPGGLAILNADDEHAMAMSTRTTGRVVTFGRNNVADYRVVSAISRFPDALTVEIAWRGGTEKISTQLIGEHFWLSVVAAFATAIELGVDIETIRARCVNFEPVRNRCQPIRVKGGPVFIVDTVKAPWHSLPLALKVIEEARAPRKRIVIGNLSDMTSSSRKYRDAYRMAREICDEVVFLGEHSHRSKASGEDRKNGRFVEASSVKDAADYVRNTAIENEVVLLKSSGNLHLERIALAWEYDVKCWEEKCGYDGTCQGCGLFEFPFDQHDQVRKNRRRE